MKGRDDHLFSQDYREVFQHVFDTVVDNMQHKPLDQRPYWLIWVSYVDRCVAAAQLTPQSYAFMSIRLRWNANYLEELYAERDALQSSDISAAWRTLYQARWDKNQERRIAAIHLLRTSVFQNGLETWLVRDSENEVLKDYVATQKLLDQIKENGFILVAPNAKIYRPEENPTAIITNLLNLSNEREGVQNYE